MLKDITIGQYYQTQSPIHKLDPRVKLVGTMVFLISLFLGRNIIMYVIATLFLAAMIKISNVPFKFMVRGLKSIVFIAIFSAVFNLFLTDGEPIVQFWIFRLTWEGVEMASFMVIRLIYLIIGSSLMTLTTTPNDLTDGLEKGLGFLNHNHRLNRRLE